MRRVRRYHSHYRKPVHELMKYGKICPYSIINSLVSTYLVFSESAGHADVKSDNNSRNQTTVYNGLSIFPRLPAARPHRKHVQRVDFATIRRRAIQPINVIQCLACCAQLS